MKSTPGIWGCVPLVGAGCLAVTVLTAAQPFNVKTGLWEVTSSSQMSGMPQMDMSSLTPDQRTRMEAAMKKGDLSAPRTTRTCMTKEKIETLSFQDKDMDPSCTRTSISNTPSLVEFKVECTGDRKMSRTMRFEAVDPQNVKATIKMNGEGAGRPMNINTTLIAKWISPDCGGVK
jgi:hypothetical protein